MTQRVFGRRSCVYVVAVATAIVASSGAIAAEPAGNAAARRLHDLAVAVSTVRGGPPASAVCMRSLAPRPSNAKDPHDTLAAIRGFHVTRLEWTYGDDAVFIRKVHDLGVEYGGAIAAGSYAGKAPPVEWNVVGLDSQRLVPPWMRQWPRPNPWGCCNNPEFRAGHVRAALAAIAVSCNNGVRSWTPIQLTFDSCIGELRAKDATPAHLHATMALARSHGRTQSVTMPLEEGGEQETPAWVRLTRQTIATMYALGGHVEMPWDTYLPTPDGQRYFGRPEHYADLTAFVRAIADRLDGHVAVYAGGCGVKDDRWQGLPPVTVADGGDVFVTVRTRPGDPAAPLVVHLVDWREEPRPIRLTVESGACFGEQPVRVRLLAPVQPYDRVAHDKAFETKDYRPLVHERDLDAGTIDRLDLPAAAPWAVVVVERAVRGAPAEKKP